MISPELAIAVQTLVIYSWNLKRHPNVEKHQSNAKVIPIVPIEIKRNNILSVRIQKKFKSFADLPIARETREKPSSVTTARRELPQHYNLENLETKMFWILLLIEPFIYQKF